MARSTLEQSAATPLLVADRFEVWLDELLGEGGISQVYAGRDLSTGGRIAAKRLRPELAADRDARRRFEREQRLSSVADHENVVRSIDDTDEWLFLEFVDGTNLKRMLADRSPLSIAEAVTIARGVAAGLDHLHQVHIVHLDVKPQNVMIAGRDGVKLIDLGLAHEFADRPLDRLGTAAYMAPEQIDQGPVDARTDVYALGCVFFELMTGRPPFVAPNPGGEDEQAFLLDAHRYDEVVPPSTLRHELPPWVDDVVDRALAKAPDHRFATAGAMIETIDRGIASLGNGHTPTRRATRQVTIQPPVTPRQDPGIATTPSGPGVMTRLLRSAVAFMGAMLRWMLRRFGGMSRRMATLATIVALVLLLNVPVISDGLMEVAIDVLPWTKAEVVTDVGVLNLRAEPSTTSDVIRTLENGSSVTITGLPRELGDTTWWPVTANGDAGWVSGEYLNESGLMEMVTLPGEFRDAVGALTGMVLP